MPLEFRPDLTGDAKRVADYILLTIEQLKHEVPWWRRADIEREKARKKANEEDKS